MEPTGQNATNTQVIPAVSPMTFSEAVRYMMDECDKHGLHHEVLASFMKEFDYVFDENEKRCRRGEPQQAPDFSYLAWLALMEWDI